jgi:P27 family predicted phage terminase small subunit
MTERLRSISPRGPQPPEHLSDEAKAWWRKVNADYALEPHHLKLLQSACESWDRAQEARRQVEAEGITVQGRYGPKINPAVAVERDARMTLVRNLRLLDLDAEAPTPTMRVRRR